MEEATLNSVDLMKTPAEMVSKNSLINIPTHSQPIAICFFLLTLAKSQFTPLVILRYLLKPIV